MKTSNHEKFFRLLLCTSMCVLFTLSILSLSLVSGGERGKYLCSDSGARSCTYYDEKLYYVVVDCRDNKEYYVEKNTVSGQEIWFLRDITQTWSKYGANKEAMEVIPLASSDLEDSELIMMGLATGRFSLKQVGKNLWRVTGSAGRTAPYTFPKHLKK